MVGEIGRNETKIPPLGVRHRAEVEAPPGRRLVEVELLLGRRPSSRHLQASGCSHCNSLGKSYSKLGATSKELGLLGQRLCFAVGWGRVTLP